MTFSRLTFVKITVVFGVEYIAAKQLTVTVFIALPTVCSACGFGIKFTVNQNLTLILLVRCRTRKIYVSNREIVSD